MTTTARIFGTDLSNVRPLHGAPLKASKKKLFSGEKKQSAALRWRTVEKANMTATVVVHEVKEEAVKEEQSTALRYTREFLLAMREKVHKAPIEGLIPEVLPGYVDISREYINEKNSVFKPKTRIAPKKADSVTVVPKVVAVAPVEPLKPAPKEEEAVPAKKPESPKEIPRDYFPELQRQVDCLLDDPSECLVAGVSSENGQAIPVVEIRLEWQPKVKKVKKEKPRESDDKRLASRQKQIDIGRNTVGYKRYMETVPINARKREEPRTPDKFQVCSKRSWDGQVRKWRRMLHQYDPEGVELDEEDYLDEIPTPSKKLAINLDEIFAYSSGVVV